MNKKVVMAALLCMGVLPGLAWAGALKGAAFKASVAPAAIRISVNRSGGIQGDTQVALRVQRIKRNKVPFCNKIRTLEVVRGNDYTISDSGPDFLLRASMPPGGRCFFDQTLNLKPFTDAELRSACKGVTSGTRRLVKAGLVTAWTDSVSEMRSLHRMWDRGGMGGTPKSQTSVTFRANIQCGAGKPPKPPVANKGRLSARCIDRNKGISVQIDMRKKRASLLMNGNRLFAMTAGYQPIRGSDPHNLIRLKGDGNISLYLNIGRKLLYFREGKQGKFCQVSLSRR